MAFLLEFYKFMKQRKKFWLWPVFIVGVSFVGLLIAVEGTAISPFIYALF